MVTLLEAATSTTAGPAVAFKEKYQNFTALLMPSSNFSFSGQMIVDVYVADSTSQSRWLLLTGVPVRQPPDASEPFNMDGVYVAMRAQLSDSPDTGSVTLKLYYD